MAFSFFFFFFFGLATELSQMANKSRMVGRMAGSPNKLFLTLLQWILILAKFKFSLILISLILNITGNLIIIMEYQIAKTRCERDKNRQGTLLLYAQSETSLMYSPTTSQLPQKGLAAGRTSSSTHIKNLACPIKTTSRVT